MKIEILDRDDGFKCFDICIHKEYKNLRDYDISRVVKEYLAFDNIEVYSTHIKIFNIPKKYIKMPSLCKLYTDLNTENNNYFKRSL